MAVTILVMEDHDTLRWSLRTWLESAFPECRVIEAADEKQATSLALTYVPAVIIVDTQFGDGRGFVPVERLKAAVPTSEIVVLTDYEDDTHRAHALASGASAYIYKRALLVQLQPVLTNMVYVAQEPVSPQQAQAQNSTNGRNSGYSEPEN